MARWPHNRRDTRLGGDTPEVGGDPADADAQEDDELHPVARHAGIHARGLRIAQRSLKVGHGEGCDLNPGGGCPHLESVVHDVPKCNQTPADENDVGTGVPKLGLLLLAAAAAWPGFPGPSYHAHRAQGPCRSGWARRLAGHGRGGREKGPLRRARNRSDVRRFSAPVRPIVFNPPTAILMRDTHGREEVARSRGALWRRETEIGILRNQ